MTLPRPIPFSVGTLRVRAEFGPRPDGRWKWRTGSRAYLDGWWTRAEAIDAARKLVVDETPGRLPAQTRTAPQPPPARRCTSPGCRGWTLVTPRPGFRLDRCIAHAEPETTVVPVRRVESADGPRWVAGTGPVVVCDVQARREGRGATWQQALGALRAVER